MYVKFLCDVGDRFCREYFGFDDVIDNIVLRDWIIVKVKGRIYFGWMDGYCLFINEWLYNWNFYLIFIKIYLWDCLLFLNKDFWRE